MSVAAYGEEHEHHVEFKSLRGTLAVGLITWNIIVSQYWMTFHTNSVAMAANRSTNTLVRLQFSFAVKRTHATAFRTTQLRG